MADLDTPSRRTVSFGPLRIDFDDRVIAPRPWTLVQSEWAAELAGGLEPGPILELCAGAGHIGLAAAVRCGRDLVQVEADPVAARYAQHNAARAGWAARTQVRARRMESAVAADERFPLIIADPPYLPTRQVRDWPEDPVTAIDGGYDGLDLIRVCLDLAARNLTGRGYVLLQVAGPAQADRVAALVHDGSPAVLAVVDRRIAADARAVVALRRAPGVPL